MSRENRAVLYLQDGTLFEGKGFGWKGESAGEVVFNTSMTGYEEILTDPSYHGQIVTMCYPHIGSYGINYADAEGYRAWSAGLIVKECSRAYSNYQAKTGLHEYLEENRIPGLEGIDTRMLVRRIRDRGSMPGIISAFDFDRESLAKKLSLLPPLSERRLVKDVISSDDAAFRRFKPSGRSGVKIAVIDFGTKLSILRHLEAEGFEVKMLSGESAIDDVLAADPDCVLLSNGPGDPQEIGCGVKLARELLALNLTRRLPVLGICLGHQLIGLGAGASTFKLKFGHHGGNHPVRELKSGKIQITAQNHDYCVDTANLKEDFEITHLNLNDGTEEGMRHRKLPVISCQHHPESGPGPSDGCTVFREFKELVNA